MPGRLALIVAHADLEGLTLERDLAHEKARLEPRFAELVYDGMWFSPLREALSAFMASTQRHVTGEVRLRFSPGRRASRSSGGAARSGSTTTASPPTTPPTPSATRTPRASCGSSASASQTWARRQGGAAEVTGRDALVEPDGRRARPRR